MLVLKQGSRQQRPNFVVVRFLTAALVVPTPHIIYQATHHKLKFAKKHIEHASHKDFTQEDLCKGMELLHQGLCRLSNHTFCKAISVKQAVQQTLKHVIIFTTWKLELLNQETNFLKSLQEEQEEDFRLAESEVELYRQIVCAQGLPGLEAEKDYLQAVFAETLDDFDVVNEQCKQFMTHAKRHVIGVPLANSSNTKHSPEELLEDFCSDAGIASMFPQELHLEPHYEPLKYPASQHQPPPLGEFQLNSGHQPPTTQSGSSQFQADPYNPPLQPFFQPNPELQPHEPQYESDEYVAAKVPQAENAEWASVAGVTYIMPALTPTPGNITEGESSQSKSEDFEDDSSTPMDLSKAEILSIKEKMKVELQHVMLQKEGVGAMHKKHAKTMKKALTVGRIAVIGHGVKHRPFKTQRVKEEMVSWMSHIRHLFKDYATHNIQKDLGL
ncbi:uncharacterized protein EDB91DRAFT_1247740 [Suillus paluster]|uniref:uncharacterized protein n=1 Tax=Suillus paluster TaxID=48578 RepID=UPI001B880132|nr:uncharacterized protein EDB91DRAFT_1247740 [Suillus paluster]KAG1742354.1 hypothetical protein EDB91DRAFT_1247740 [Suillus paluster]